MTPASGTATASPLFGRHGPHGVQAEHDRGGRFIIALPEPKVA